VWSLATATENTPYPASVQLSRSPVKDPRENRAPGSQRPVQNSLHQQMSLETAIEPPQQGHIKGVRAGGIKGVRDRQRQAETGAGAGAVPEDRSRKEQRQKRKPSNQPPSPTFCK
jgi:hypothetical protein